ncbi:urea ABC transporter permease subunit UrtC [Bradyrhizobium erythrophlei]|uniref:Amino acid/amide ABC transporter membrane protein 2, HAAT family n=1 Tax=Bradyrhizobium erythrophlei TaxID=1437360 RepID=A0A1H4UL26_9BRAD|nr:urea ABC transporter permease subunit UrtC [Bradyrhizobium erythrophlei]SEC69479.1 amino acid/amide ABC transporter membrane protein 2, HAAT family [Bradyrhizobium erythrophlei]
MRKLSKKSLIDIAFYAVFIIAILIAPRFLEEFGLNRLAKFLVYGMLGIAVALSWGYAGILNLGQGLFFGLGAYMIAMSLKLASPTSLQQGSDKPVPDFMLWNAEPGSKTDLCCINAGSFVWIPFKHQWFGMALAVILPTVIAFLVGSVIFRKKIAGVFISVITLSLVLLVRLLIIDAQPLTNGWNGLTDLGTMTLGSVEFDPFSVQTYYLVSISLAITLVAIKLLTQTRAGMVLQAIRDDQNRVVYLGFDVPMYQIFFFAVSALIAGYAGMLYVLVAEFASPTFMDLSFSITMVVWAAVGGRASLLGACIGAIVINSIEASVSETKPLVEAWKVIIGLLFVVVVLYMPRGLAGLMHSAIDWVLDRSKPYAADVESELLEEQAAE